MTKNRDQINSERIDSRYDLFIQENVSHGPIQKNRYWHLTDVSCYVLENLPNAMTKDDFKELMPRYIDPSLLQIKP